MSLITIIHSRSFMRSSLSQYEIIASHLLNATDHIPPQGPSLPALCPDLCAHLTHRCRFPKTQSKNLLRATPLLAKIGFFSFNTNYAPPKTTRYPSSFSNNATSPRWACTDAQNKNTRALSLESQRKQGLPQSRFACRAHMARPRHLPRSGGPDSRSE